MIIQSWKIYEIRNWSLNLKNFLDLFLINFFLSCLCKFSVITFIETLSEIEMKKVTHQFLPSQTIFEFEFISEKAYNILRKVNRLKGSKTIKTLRRFF